jgi:hypothetical protein
MPLVSKGSGSVSQKSPTTWPTTSVDRYLSRSIFIMLYRDAEIFKVDAISEVTTAVAHGDLSKQIPDSAFFKGDVREMRDCINMMVNQLAVLASEARL